MGEERDEREGEDAEVAGGTPRPLSVRLVASVVLYRSAESDGQERPAGGRLPRAGATPVVGLALSSDGTSSVLWADNTLDIFPSFSMAGVSGSRTHPLLSRQLGIFQLPSSPHSEILATDLQTPATKSAKKRRAPASEVNLPPSHAGPHCGTVLVSIPSTQYVVLVGRNAERKPNSGSAPSFPSGALIAAVIDTVYGCVHSVRAVLNDEDISPARGPEKATMPSRIHAVWTGKGADGGQLIVSTAREVICVSVEGLRPLSLAAVLGALVGSGSLGERGGGWSGMATEAAEAAGMVLDDEERRRITDTPRKAAAIVHLAGGSVTLNEGEGNIFGPGKTKGVTGVAGSDGQEGGRVKERGGERRRSGPEGASEAGELGGEEGKIGEVVGKKGKGIPVGQQATRRARVRGRGEKRRKGIQSLDKEVTRSVVKAAPVEGPLPLLGDDSSLRREEEHEVGTMKQVEGLGAGEEIEESLVAILVDYWRQKELMRATSPDTRQKGRNAIKNIDTSMGSPVNGDRNEAWTGGRVVTGEGKADGETRKGKRGSERSPWRGERKAVTEADEAPQMNGGFHTPQLTKEGKREGKERNSESELQKKKGEGTSGASNGFMPPPDSLADLNGAGLHETTGTVADGEHAKWQAVEAAAQSFSPALCSLVVSQCLRFQLWNLLELLVKRAHSGAFSSTASLLVQAAIEHKQLSLLVRSLLSLPHLPTPTLFALLQFLLARAGSGHRAEGSDSWAARMRQRGQRAVRAIGALRRSQHGERAREGEGEEVEEDEEEGNHATKRRDSLKGRKKLKKEEAYLQKRAEAMAAALDHFSDAELPLHALVAVPRDEEILAGAVRQLTADQISCLLKYLRKWMEKYVDSLAPAIHVAARDRGKEGLAVPTLRLVMEWVSTIVDCHLAQLILLRECHDDLRAIQRCARLQASMARGLLPLAGMLSHLGRGLPLPGGGPGLGGGMGSLSYTVELLDLT
eukprot:TRINITY_DN21724_c0_g1_i1.p1 TRINITY_DN21724_c0_g1~~TRINITY_DN21724_c0_g1_i1.p1  ORF type:complete len:979 (-),score=202.12 TRINITY_DN21724_c0_g1_i1:1201-4116(-)